MHYNPNNTFNRIISKEIEANIILEDERHISFHDINPQAKIHALILPKIHCIDFEDFLKCAKSPEEVKAFFDFIVKVAFEFQVKDYKLITNKGQNAGQEIMHFHMHLLARGSSGLSSSR